MSVPSTPHHIEAADGSCQGRCYPRHIYSFSNLSYDRSKASSKASCPHSAIYPRHIYIYIYMCIYIYIYIYNAAFNKKRTLFTSTLDLELRKKLLKCYIWSTALYGAETWMFRAVDQKHLESFEMWCWRRMEKISRTDYVRNEEVLLRVKEQRNILHEIRKRKANWIGHILRRNCLLQLVTEGKI